MNMLKVRHDISRETLEKIKAEIMDLIDMDAYTEFQKGARRGLIWAYKIIVKHTGEQR